MPELLGWPTGGSRITKETTVTDINTQWHTVATADGPMRLYAAYPPRPATRAVVVLQEAFGVNEHIQDITRRFAERGFLAMAPDMFHRNGVAELRYDQHAEAMPLIGAIGPEAITTDISTVLQKLADEGFAQARIAIIGFCFGGRAAFTAATAAPGLGAAAVFYGPGIAAGPHAVLDRAGSITAPLLLHVGSQDPTIPPEQVEAIDSALRASGAEFAQHLYDGAGHAFACDARPHMFREPAATQAWDRTYGFIDEHIPAK
jgi:carboxymethylenebutenolidase